MIFDPNTLNDPKVIEAAGVLLREIQQRRPRRPAAIVRQEGRIHRLERRRERFIKAVRTNLRWLELTPEELLARLQPAQ